MAQPCQPNCRLGVDFAGFPTVTLFLVQPVSGVHVPLGCPVSPGFPGLVVRRPWILYGYILYGFSCILYGFCNKKKKGMLVMLVTVKSLMTYVWEVPSFHRGGRQMIRRVLPVRGNRGELMGRAESLRAAPSASARGAVPPDAGRSGGLGRGASPGPAVPWPAGRARGRHPCSAADRGRPAPAHVL